MKLFTDPPDAAGARRAATKYPQFAAWFQDKLANRWELMSLNAELDDYGVADWKGRSLDTAFSKVSLRLKNRMLGDYEDACFVFTQITDAEFSVSRDPAVASCDEGERVGDWKRGHSSRAAGSSSEGAGPLLSAATPRRTSAPPTTHAEAVLNGRTSLCARRI